jgi:hypothetical protein
MDGQRSPIGEIPGEKCPGAMEGVFYTVWTKVSVRRDMKVYLPSYLFRRCFFLRSFFRLIGQLIFQSTDAKQLCFGLSCGPESAVKAPGAVGTEIFPDKGEKQPMVSRNTCSGILFQGPFSRLRTLRSRCSARTSMPS